MSQTNEKLYKDNKLIGKFCELLVPTNTAFNNESSDFYFIPFKERIITRSNIAHYSELKFHSKWEWIMPVFERIQYIDDRQDEFLDDFYNIDITIDLLNGVTFKIDKKRIFMQTAFGEGQLIEALHAGIVAFIEWYNEHKIS